MNRAIRRCWECGRVHDEDYCPECGCEAGTIERNGDYLAPTVDPADLDDCDEEVNTDWLED